MILVTGATGNVGTEVVRALAASGQQVRALTRSGRADLPAGTEQVTGDLDDPASMRPALEGTAALFLYPGYQNLAATLAEARKAAVRQVVLLSSSAVASGDTTNAITRYMAGSETAVRESGLAWTILRSFGFMSNTLQWIPQLKAGDQVQAAFASVPVAMIDPYDIAAVAATALTSGRHDGQICTISGPEPLRPADRVRILAGVLGRDLTFRAQPDDEARAEMSASMPAEYVEAFFDYYVAGHLDESGVRPDVQQITGHPPRTFRQWAQAHAGSFPAREG